MTTHEDRHPLLGPELDCVQVRHDQELDALAADFEELRAHQRETEPRILGELSNVRRLRQELARARKETQLCERSLEMWASERSRQQSLSGESASRALRLEMRAEEMIRASPALQRHLYVESETDCLRLERQELLQQVRQLDQENLHREQRVWNLSADVAKRAAELNMTAATGAPLLRGLADAYDAIAVAGPSTQAAAVDVSSVAQEVQVVATELETQRQTHSADLLRAPMLEAALSQVQRAQDKILAQHRDEREMQETLLQAASDMSEECIMQRQEACSSTGTAFDLQRVYIDLQADLKRTEASMRSTLDSHLGRCQALAERNVQLEWEVQSNCQGQQELQRASSLQAGPDRLLPIALELREHCEHMQARQLEVWRQSESVLARQRVQRVELNEAKRASLTLLASWRTSQERCRNLQADCVKARSVTEEVAREAESVNNERLQSAEEASDAGQRCKDVLEAMALQQHKGDNLDARLASSLEQREMMQESLSNQIAGTSRQLQELRQARHCALREVASLQRESQALRSVLVD